MNKAILTALVFCFVVFSAGAQVESTKSTSSQKNAVEQSKIQKQSTVDARAAAAGQADEQVANPNAPVISFEKMEHDYGTLDYGSDGKCEFKFTNEGKEPLILTNVKAS